VPDDVIRAQGLTKRFDGFTAVDGISFQVSRGECFGLLGPNGAGKTSAIRMVYGYSPITSGKLTVFGMDVTSNLRQIKARIGICSQENNLDPDFTVLRNLEVYARYFGIGKAEARKRALELLDFVGLGGKANARIPELSGGMMRRLVVARALINDPELVILDEPTTGLDPQSRHQVWERLDDLKARGLSVLLTTHYMDEAARLCDRLVIMDQGKILVEGPPRELIKRYIGADVIEAYEPSDWVMNYVQERGLKHDTLPRRVIIYTDEGERIFRDIADRCAERACTLRNATLEDVFLKLTGRGLRE